MLDKPSPANAAFFPLPGHAIVVLHGRDALAFAQAQFMSDVAALADGDWQWSGWLNPKGRVLALFALLRRDAETAWLVLADADPAVLVAALRGFVFRSRVTLATGADHAVSGAFAAPACARLAHAGAADEAIELDLGGDGGERTLRLARPGDAAIDSSAVDRWHAFDLAHGWPRLTPPQLGRWTPQQLSLDRLRAYSVRKGCYPGQEIVARTHFLGQARRGLVLLASGSPLSPGADIERDGQGVGSVVSAGADGRLALAVLPVDDASAALASGGHPLSRLPLQGGLER